VRGSRGAFTIGKVGYAVACAAAAIVLVVSGYAHDVVSLTSALGDGASLGSGPSTGAMNILLMGLESRTNFQGQVLSARQLTETHSGNYSQVAAGLEGSQDTDTLILIHVFAGGQKATGFSIPRDDVVNYPHEVYPNGTSAPGYTEGKIDAAYAYAYDQSLSQTVGSDMSSAERYLLANQAGELFQVQTVESVTGVHIDHFLVSNIIGFYEMARQFGGLEICIQPAPAQGGLPAGANLTDYDPLTGTDNSGFNAYQDGYDRKKGGRQYLHLSPAQSLAYVRSRDTLPGVDIGRTARQQAAIEYLLWKFKHDGVLSDLGQVTSLLSAARGYLMYDQGWDLATFAQGMRALAASHLHFTTLPELSTNNVSIPGYPGLQSADYVDEPQIQQQVARAFYGTVMPPPGASQVTVSVYNGSGAAGLAAAVSADLAAMGYKAGAVANASAQSRQVQAGTQVFYGAGSSAAAGLLASLMGVQQATPLSSLPAGQVEVLLGSQVTAQPAGLEMFGAGTVTPADYLAVAQRHGTTLPAGVQAAAAASPSAEVPAYSQARASSPSSPSSSSTSSSGSASRAGSASGKHAAAGTGKKASTGSSSSSSPPYGLTSCPY
jgi:anionic cell wall polymer biosynthesis LytR-Cps2A-Psr (LCP) family protein